MSPRFAHLLTVAFILTTLSFSLAAAACNEDGWFGSSSCLYQCHCAGDVLCDKVTGSCPQGCHSGWFGPACQYESIPFTPYSSTGSTLNVPWLTDDDVNTCNDGSLQALTVLLNTPQPLTWVRLVVSEAGRNVALKQTTQQSNTWNRWYASNAVDGDPGNPGSSPYLFERTCTHTPSSNPNGWWRVTFSREAVINRIVIYNRRRNNPEDINYGCCEYRLQGFMLEAFEEGDSSAIYNFVDTALSAQQIYTVVPQTRISVNVKTVRITKSTSSQILTLCEVLVFGETACPSGTFGLECDKPCNCADDQEVCFVSTGGCPSGCAPGFTGGDCLTSCPRETYGLECAQNCSVHCMNSKICSSDDGHCVGGCKPGFIPPLCDNECPKTKFGQDCAMNCSFSCVESDCHHVNGTCKECPAGFVGDFCEEECPVYTFGVGCAENCSVLCLDQLCNHVTGVCDNCTDSRQGRFCEIVITEPPPVNEGPVGTGEQSEGGGGDGATIGVAVGAAVGLVVLVIIIFVFIRRRRLRSSKDGDENVRQRHSLKNDRELNVSSSSIKIDASGSSSTDNKTETNAPLANRIEDNPGSVYSNVLPGNTSLHVKDLSKYLNQHTTPSEVKKQFESVPMTNSYSQSQGLASHNVKKNRYKNIVPYDHSRVLLQADSDKKFDDYINASFIKRYNGTDTYIAAQAPNSATLHDFVRMLWEKQVDRIVMLTNLVELRKNDEDPRTLTQFHFTAWPDKSVPDSPWGLVDLHQRVMAAPGFGPLLVHCSAGVGRTGTFIALCHLLQEAEATRKMDFLSTLWRLRQDRMSMIQTVDQYQFLHRAALIGHTVSGTRISVADLSSRLRTLEEQDGTGSGYTSEFKAVAAASDEKATQPAFAADDTEDVYQNSRAALNKQKNRLSNILPKDTYRPELQGDGKTTGTYINAVLVPTLTKDRQDILTQLPLPSTVTDFWRLVTQYHVGLIVAYESESRHTDETIGEFLPKDESNPLQDALFQIQFTTKEEHRLWQELHVSVSKKKKTLLGNTAEQHDVTCLLCKDTRPVPEIVLEYVQKIRLCRPEGQSRTLYMCRNGADHCGLMCVQSILLNRLEVDQCLVVPLVVGAIKAIRPQVIPTVGQYKCLYETLKLAQDAATVYGNVGTMAPSPLDVKRIESNAEHPQTEDLSVTSKEDNAESGAVTAVNPRPVSARASNQSCRPQPKPRMRQETEDASSHNAAGADARDGGERAIVVGGGGCDENEAYHEKENIVGDYNTGADGIDNPSFQTEPSMGFTKENEATKTEYFNM
ncbi:receptor-type tyrosine-protein phosphatase kappa [Elysia marginata]|uniref:Receptor-type tyrosine-protein phosphatase kappa n=1 Tax=Elysia marginata TaxID=1093978 RepID=A0AAV4EQS6_9GAST|nr:receptor-type tyrosine-protein phosphatase kappa [Elysia marginata]